MQRSSHGTRPIACVVAATLATLLLLLFPAVEMGQGASSAHAASKRSKRSRNARAKRGGRATAVRSNRYITVRARNLRLTPRARQRLMRIAKRYRKATGHKLVITGGTRTALRQAQLMYGKLARGENIARLYSAVTVRPIIASYRKGKKKRHAKRRIIRAMRRVIVGQMKRGLYISRHLQAGAADVRSRNMNQKRLHDFRSAVAAYPGVILIY